MICLSICYQHNLKINKRKSKFGIRNLYHSVMQFKFALWRLDCLYSDSQNFEGCTVYWQNFSFVHFGALLDNTKYIKINIYFYALHRSMFSMQYGHDPYSKSRTSHHICDENVNILWCHIVTKLWLSWKSSNSYKNTL